MMKPRVLSMFGQHFSGCCLYVHSGMEKFIKERLTKIVREGCVMTHALMPRRCLKFCPQSSQGLSLALTLFFLRRSEQLCVQSYSIAKLAHPHAASRGLFKGTKMGWILHNPLFVIALSYTINIISPQSPARKTVFSVRMESVFHWSISVTVFHTVRMAPMKHTVVCMLYFQENTFVTLTSKCGF